MTRRMGALWMLVAGFLFGCMGVFAKIGAQDYSSMELVFYRSFVGLLVVYAVIRQQRGSIATAYPLGHLWRGISGTLALMLFFYCIAVLPLATAVTLNYTSALFLALLVVLVFKERFHAPLSFAIALGFIGVMLLLHPTMERNQMGAGLIGLISGFLAGVALLNVRQLAVKGEPELRVVFYFSLIATIGSGAIVLLGDIHGVGLRNLPILLGMGASATFAQLAMTRAYGTGKTLVVGGLSYSTVVFASLFGILFWGETLSLSGWAGIVLIVTGGVLCLKLSPRL